MRDCKSHAIFAHFRRHVGPGICSEPDCCDEHPSKKRGTVLTDPAFGEIHQEHLPLVYDFTNMEVLFGRSENTIQKGIGKKCPDLVLYGRRSISAVPKRKLLELLLKERAHRFVLQRL